MRITIGRFYVSVIHQETPNDTYSASRFVSSKNSGCVFFRNTVSSSIARERMIVTDTGCNNILVVGDYATSVSRRVAAATDALTIVGRSAQHGINPLLQGRIILPNLPPGGGGQRRRD